MFNLIAAYSANRVIGHDQKIPWDLPRDLERFKSLTMNGCLIMGRKTYQSLPVKPLPDREHIVLSKNPPKESDDRVQWVGSKKEAVNQASVFDDDKVWIAGGSTIYSQFIDVCDKFYLTVVMKKINGDTFFPDWNRGEWDLNKIEHHKQNDVPFVFMDFERH